MGVNFILDNPYHIILENISNYKIYFQVSEMVGRIACGGRRCSMWIFLHLEATPHGMG
jgi:hypothetical protein